MGRMRKYIAECFGTMILVFIGCGSAMVLGTEIGIGHFATALAFGLALIAAAYAIGGISGCQINPAVSLAMLLTGRMNGKDFIGYVIAQIIGAILGTALLFAMTSFGIADVTGTFGSNSVTNAGGIGGALFIEIILTFIFVYTVLGVISDISKKTVAGIVIGLTLVVVHTVGIPITGTSVNPARSIGPALFAGGESLSVLWVFILAPLVGSAIAAIVFNLLNKTKENIEQ